MLCSLLSRLGHFPGEVPIAFPNQSPATLPQLSRMSTQSTLLLSVLSLSLSCLYVTPPPPPPIPVCLFACVCFYPSTCRDYFTLFLRLRRRRSLRQELGHTPPYAGGSPQVCRSSRSPMCHQPRFLLSGSGDSDSPAESVPPPWVVYHGGMQRILQCGIL